MKWKKKKNPEDNSGKRIPTAFLPQENQLKRKNVTEKLNFISLRNS